MKGKMNKIQIDISTATVVKLILAFFAVAFLYVTREILVTILIVLIIVMAVSPLVDRFSRRMPRALVVAILALLILAIFAGIGFAIIPPLVEQIKQLAINLPAILIKLGPVYQQIQSYLSNYQEGLFNISSQMTSLSGFFSKTIGLVSGLFLFITIIVLSFYLLLDKEAITKAVYNFLPEEKQRNATEILSKISAKMSQWLGGHLLLMLVIGILDGVALAILGVPYALVLGIWGGLMELLPYLGPWLGAIPAFFVALTVSPLTGLFVLAAFFLIQLLESQFLAPKIIGRATGLSPVIIIVVLLFGAKLMGLLGVIIAVPIAAVIAVLIQEWPNIKELFR